MKDAEIRIFRRKLDIYYAMLLVYVVTGALYIVVSGSFIGDKFEFVVRDPVVYIFAVFVLYAAALLVVNVVRRRRIEITPQSIRFASRFGGRTYYFNHIERIILKRERRRLSDAIFNVVKLRSATRRRWIRIRVANFERERELYETFEDLKRTLKK
jgi:hypothetical protein